jgi:hypothetical protein
MIIRGKLKGRRIDPWAYDNGAFVDWRASKPFASEAFLADLRELQEAGSQPDFVVLPDRVAEGVHSLRLSLGWLDRLRELQLCSWPLYLAVQDGMSRGDIPWGEVDGIFVGGTVEWKTATVDGWTRAAHQHSVPCHYARCGTRRKVLHAKSIGCDSLDSSLPLWSADNARVFLDALAQCELY